MVVTTSVTQSLLDKGTLRVWDGSKSIIEYLLITVKEEHAYVKTS